MSRRSLAISEVRSAIERSGRAALIRRGGSSREGTAHLKIRDTITRTIGALPQLRSPHEPTTIPTTITHDRSDRPPILNAACPTANVQQTCVRTRYASQFDAITTLSQLHIEHRLKRR